MPSDQHFTIHPLETPRERGYVMRWRWPWDAFLLLGGFVAVFDVMIISMMIGVVAEGEWAVLVMAFAVGAFPFVISYLLIATLFNRTEITVNRERLRVHHGPLPWWGGARVPLTEVRGAAAILRRTKGNRGRADRITHDVVVELQNSRRINVFTGRASEAEAAGIVAALNELVSAPGSPLKVGAAVPAARSIRAAK